MTAPQGRFHWGSPDEGARVSHARRRARHGRIGFWYRLALVILRPPLTVVTHFLADRAADESFASWVARADEQLLRGETLDRLDARDPQAVAS